MPKDAADAESPAELPLKEALAYIDAAGGDEMLAAFALAAARNRQRGAPSAEDDPDDVEVHHALAALRRARGLERPRYDQVRHQLRAAR